MKPVLVSLPVWTNEDRHEDRPRRSSGVARAGIPGTAQRYDPKDRGAGGWSFRDRSAVRQLSSAGVECRTGSRSAVLAQPRLLSDAAMSRHTDWRL